MLLIVGSRQNKEAQNLETCLDNSKIKERQREKLREIYSLIQRFQKLGDSWSEGWLLYLQQNKRKETETSSLQSIEIYKMIFRTSLN